MKIIDLPVGKIQPAAYNPRKDLKPGDPAYERLKKSVERFSLVQPLVWNKRTGNLVSGHQRFKILVERGDKVIPVLPVDLDDREEKALNLALNKQGGEWDYADLSKLVGELKASDFDLEVAGFSEDEVMSMADVGRLKPVSERRPPALTWVLIGVPTARFGEVAETVDALAKIEGVICETTATDGTGNKNR